MKLRSLFLASLAAIAMASCSNNDEVLNNGDDAEKAYLQFSIAMPASPAGTRAADTPNHYQPGTKEEQNWSTATIFMTYDNGNTASYTFSKNDFAPDVEAAPGNGAEPQKNGTWKLKEANVKEVLEGTVKEIVVYLNETTRQTGLTAATANTTNYSSTANSGNFLMNGYGADIDGKILNGINNNTIEFEAGKTTTVKAKVNRVVAKIENETTEIKKLTPSTSEDGLEIGETTFVFELDSYVITNQAKIAGEFGGATASAEEDFNVMHKVHSAENTGTELWSTYQASAIGFGTDASKVTYVLANNSDDYKSQLIVKAKARIVGENGEAEAKTFYEYKGKIYMTYGAVMKEAFSLAEEPVAGEGDDTIETLAKYGIYKYVDGVCYYHADIIDEGDSENSLKANNWYKFKISHVNTLGTPEVDVPLANPAKLDLKVEIVNWTVWSHEIELGK